MNTIFTLYINVSKKDLEVSDNTHIADKFADNFEWLVSKQSDYAAKIGADYHFIKDDDYHSYRQWFLNNHPYVNEYCIVNFYKIHLIYKLSKKYDNVLYLDLDVIPITDENIFDLNADIAVRVNHEEDPKNYMTPRKNQSDRSPYAKWHNCRAMRIFSGEPGDNDVYNTGIVLASRRGLKKLNYFDKFSDTLEYMHEIKEQSGEANFGYDNETLFSYKMLENNVTLTPLDEYWHHAMRGDISYIPSKTKMVHAINKDFDYVKEYCEKNHL